MFVTSEARSMIDDRDLIGMEKQAAIDLCKSQNVKVRVVAEDGEHFMGTCDYWPERRNLSITNGKVDHVGRG